MNIPMTEQRPRDCVRYRFYPNSMWMHRCAYNNMPCKILIKNICPDFTPKTEKDGK